MAPARKFDWDDAKRRYQAGESQAEIARSVGVSRTALRFALYPLELASSRKYTAEWQRQAVCAVCGGQCGRYGGQDPASYRCRSCANKAQATSVRDNELRCQTCREWKHDLAFPHNRLETVRRGRHRSCRDCNTALRKAYRERIKVPCDKCGKPRLPAQETQGATGLCRNCYQLRHQ